MHDTPRLPYLGVTSQDTWAAPNHHRPELEEVMVIDQDPTLPSMAAPPSRKAVLLELLRELGLQEWAEQASPPLRIGFGLFMQQLTGLTTEQMDQLLEQLHMITDTVERRYEQALQPVPATSAAD